VARSRCAGNWKSAAWQAPDFTIDTLTHAVDALPPTTTGRRDKVILLLGFTGLFRRDGLVSLDVSHLSVDKGSVLIRLMHSKTNQLGEVEEKAVRRVNGPYCAVTALEALLTDLPPLVGAGSNPVFCSHQRGKLVTGKRLNAEWVNRVVGNTLGHSTDGLKFTAHSLRASFVTISKQNGIDNRVIVNQTKHRNTVMINRYDYRCDVLEHNATDKLGL